MRLPLQRSGVSFPRKTLWLLRRDLALFRRRPRRGGAARRRADGLAAAAVAVYVESAALYRAHLLRHLCHPLPDDGGGRRAVAALPAAALRTAGPVLSRQSRHLSDAVRRPDNLPRASLLFALRAPDDAPRSPAARAQRTGRRLEGDLKPGRFEAGAI